MRVSPKKTFLSLTVAVLALGLGGLAYRQFHRPDFGPADKPAVPVGRLTWVEEYQLAMGKPFPADPELLFVGDSLTRSWMDSGRAAWDQTWAGRNAAVLAAGRDGTQHVLWRLSQNQLPPAIHPKLIVLLLGTNNISFEESTDEVVAGIGAVVRELHARLPAARVMVMGIFPRHPTPHRIRDRVRAVNAAVAAKAAEWNVTPYDFGNRFLDPAGNLTSDISPDALHLTSKGYQIWSQALIERFDAEAAAGGEGALASFKSKR